MSGADSPLLVPILDVLGDAQRAAGQPRDARATWERAIALAGAPADTLAPIRTKLATLAK